MMLFIKLAWRNIFRNKRRTFLSGLAIGLGLAAMMVMDALLLGTSENMIANATSTFLGEGQIHREGFRNTFEVERTIVNAPVVLEKLQGNPQVKQATPRTASFAMITSTASVQSVMLYGIAPGYEKDISKIDDLLVSGDYLSSDNETKILVGEKLAELLEAGIGDKLVVTVAQAETGELSQEMFRIGGIFKFGSRQMDSGLAFVPIKRAQEMLKIDGQFHEISFTFNNKLESENEQLPLWHDFSAQGNEALGWTKLVPALHQMRAMSSFGLFIAGIILFGVVAIGIVNTLFMSLYERMFEFGVMRAVGTRPYQAALLMLLEAASLAVIAIVIGTTIGAITNAILLYTGIDYTGTEYMSIAIREYIYPVITPLQFTLYPILLFLFTCLVGLYPALYAARLTPAKAMKRGL